MSGLPKTLVMTGGVALALVVALIALWAWVLAGSNPLANKVSTWVPWPVACSTRGCITTTTWYVMHDAQTRFAAASRTSEPGPEQSLTTAVRQFLVTHASIQELVTPEEIERYRHEVLNLTDEEKTLETTGLTLAEYEEFVLHPYLTQEALRQQRRAENERELFQQLAQERWLTILPLNFEWNTTQATVETGP